MTWRGAGVPKDGGKYGVLTFPARQPVKGSWRVKSVFQHCAGALNHVINDTGTIDLSFCLFLSQTCLRTVWRYCLLHCQGLGLLESSLTKSTPLWANSSCVQLNVLFLMNAHLWTWLFQNGLWWWRWRRSQQVFKVSFLYVPRFKEAQVASYHLTGIYRGLNVFRHWKKPLPVTWHGRGVWGENGYVYMYG